MSVRNASKRAGKNASVQKGATGISFKDTDQKKDIKNCVKFLENGELHLADVEEFKDEFLFRKPYLGDHIQYELHKYCQKNVGQINADVVVKLAELCYSHESVSLFSNIDRFVGCVYYISSLLLKKERFKSALNVFSSLWIKKNEVLERSKKKPDTMTFLCNLHNAFIASAVTLALKIDSVSHSNYQICHQLAVESLNVFKLTGILQNEIGKKVLKKTVLYLQTLKYYKEEDILQFYQTLDDVLKILLPHMRNLDFFLLYLTKINQFKKTDCGMEIYEELRATVRLLTIFLNSSLMVRKMLNEMLDFFWNDQRKDSWMGDEMLKLLKEDNSQSQLYFLLVSSIFSHGMQFFWTKFGKTWCENVTVEFVEKLSGFMITLHKSHCKSEILYCSSLKRSFEGCFGDLLTGNLQKIQYTVRLCLKNKVPNALPLVSISQEAFMMSMEDFENMKCMGCCLKQKIYSWKLSVIHHTNTVEDMCRVPTSDESLFYLKECSRAILKEIVNSELELPFDYSHVKILFQRWHTASLKLKNYQEALFACVVYYIFYPNEEKDITSMWIQTKSESSNEIFQEITMGEIFKTCDKSLREFSKRYNGSNVCLKSALLMELRAYSRCFPDIFQNPNTSYNLSSRIWKQLEKYKLDLWESSLAMSSMILASIAGDYEKLPNGFQEKCEKLIEGFVNQQSMCEMRCRGLLHAANLIFSLFLYNLKMAERSVGKMDTGQMVLGYLKKAEEEKVKFGEDVDLNLTCDVIPSSTHLTVELETNYLSQLNKIVDLWGEALKSGFEPDFPTSLEFDLWLWNVKHVANTYELIGEYQKAATAWLMLYRIGKLCNDSGARLLGLSHLIKNCADFDASGMKEEAELISGRLGSDTQEKHVLIEYSLAVASNYLKNKRPDKCLEYLSIAKKFLEGLHATIRTYTLGAKFWCLVSQFLVVYKEYEAVFGYPKSTDVRVMALKAFTYANGGVKIELIKSATQSECTELVLAMLEVNLWAYHLHGVYRQTDFMRFFLDELYQIVQKLFLPTRTAQILARLAEVDLICEKGPDCQEKVNKLKSILTTMSTGCDEAGRMEKSASPYLSVPRKNDVEASATRPISPVRFLDDRSRPKEIDLSPIHPYLKEGTPSKAVEHARKCKCRLCQNLLVQTLTMETLCLEAEIRHLVNDSRQAAGGYGKACDVLNRVELARAEQSRILRLELASVLDCDPGEMDFRLAAVQFHCARFLIRLALFESSSSRSVTETVSKTILRIGKLMKRFSYEEKLLQWSFTELKLFCVVLNKGVTRSPKKTTPVLFKTGNIAKTPTVNDSLARTPAMAKNGGMFEKSPLGFAEIKKISSDDEKSSPDDIVNATLDTNQKVLRQRKLSFHSAEPETNTKTVRKVSKSKLNNVPPRKLDFDVSADLFEEEEETKTTMQSPAEATPAESRAMTRSRKMGGAPPPPPPASGKKRADVRESVKIYRDAKDEAKPKKIASKGRKTEKKTKMGKGVKIE